METALTNLRLNSSQLSAQHRALNAAQQAGRLTSVRYRSGLASYFEVVDADRQALPAARTLAQAAQLRYDVLLVRRTRRQLAVIADWLNAINQLFQH